MKAQRNPMEQWPVQRHSGLCQCVFVLQGGAVKHPVLSTAISYESMTSRGTATLN